MNIEQMRHYYKLEEGQEVEFKDPNSLAYKYALHKKATPKIKEFIGSNCVAISFWESETTELWKKIYLDPALLKWPEQILI